MDVKPEAPTGSPKGGEPTAQPSSMHSSSDNKIITNSEASAQMASPSGGGREGAV
jgi:hypothetical protein